MKQFFVILLFISAKAFSQSINIMDKAVYEIAAHERPANLRIYSPNGSLASSNFRVTYYRCFWEINPSITFIKGAVTSYFITNIHANSITYDMSSQLLVDSVYFHGNKISFSRTVTDVVQIDFPVTISAGQKDSVTIFYKGIPPNSGFGSFNRASHNGVPVLWTLSQAYGSRDWWPCRNGLDDKTDSIDIIISCPNLYRASANGLLVGETDNGITRTSFYKHRYPITSYLVAIAITNYKVLIHSVQLDTTNLPMITYCYPERETEFLAVTPKILEALSLFHQHFGAYPFINERYGHTQFSWGGGMEHQTNSFITTTNQDVMVHELAHQWFGNKITCGSWHDAWLNEGFATYLTFFYLEKSDSARHPDRLRDLNNAITDLPDGSVYSDDTTNLERIFDQRLSYAKGAYLLHMLRWVLGDSTFFRAIRQYVNDPTLAYGFASTEDLKRKLEQVSGKNLTEFFNDWFFGQGHPSYEVKWDQDINNKAKISITQYRSHPSVSFFEMPLPLRFKNSTQQKTIVVNSVTNNEVFIEDIGFKADTVLVDPDYRILSRYNIAKKNRPPAPPKRDVKVYPVPSSNSAVTISINNPPAKTMSLRIYNTMGQLVWQQQLNTPDLNQTIQVNISKLSAGTYLLCIDANDFNVTRHIIKK